MPNVPETFFQSLPLGFQQKLGGNGNVNSPDKLGKALAQPVEELGAAHAAAQVAIDDKVHGAHLGHLHPLDEIPILPVAAHEALDAVPRHEGAEPRPLLVRMHVQADIDVGALVAGAGERDVAQGPRKGRAKRGERGGVCGFVVVPGREGFRLLGRTDDDALRVVAEDVDGFFDVGLLDEGGVEAEEGLGRGSSHVEREVHALD